MFRNVVVVDRVVFVKVLVSEFMKNLVGLALDLRERRRLAGSLADQTSASDVEAGLKDDRYTSLICAPVPVGDCERVVSTRVRLSKLWSLLSWEFSPLCVFAGTSFR